MTDDNDDFLVRSGFRFHCGNKHYICAAARDIPNVPGARVKSGDFTDWAPGIEIGMTADDGRTIIPRCPTCGEHWLKFGAKK